MDGFCRAQGRGGSPKQGNPPRLYSLMRYQNSLAHVCALAERGDIPWTYPPPVALGLHVRAQPHPLTSPHCPVHPLPSAPHRCGRS